MIRRILIKNKLEEIEKVATFIEGIGAELHLSGSLVASINLAIEEAIVNVIMYAYPKTEVNDISLTVECKNDELMFILTDKGVPFDPTEAEEVDISKSLDQRPVGGLGIFLVRKIMGEVSYQRINDKNQLTMTKKIKTED